MSLATIEGCVCVDYNHVSWATIEGCVCAVGPTKQSRVSIDNMPTVLATDK